MYMCVSEYSTYSKYISWYTFLQRLCRFLVKILKQIINPKYQCELRFVQHCGCVHFLTVCVEKR